MQFRQQESDGPEAAAGEVLEAAKTEEPAEAASEMPVAELAEMPVAELAEKDGHSKNTVVERGKLSHIDLGAQVRPGMERGGIFRGCRWGTTRDDAGKVIVSQAI